MTRSVRFTPEPRGHLQPARFTTHSHFDKDIQEPHEELHLDSQGRNPRKGAAPPSLCSGDVPSPGAFGEHSSPLHQEIGEGAALLAVESIMTEVRQLTGSATAPHRSARDSEDSQIGPNRLLESPRRCHPEEPKATKDLRFCLILQMPRFFASLRMTPTQRFSAACYGSSADSNVRGSSKPQIPHSAPRGSGR